MAASDNPGADMLAIDLVKVPGDPARGRDAGAGLRRGRRQRPAPRRPFATSSCSRSYRSLMVHAAWSSDSEVLGTLFLRASREARSPSARCGSVGSPPPRRPNALKNALLYRDVVAGVGASPSDRGEAAPACSTAARTSSSRPTPAGRITEFNRAAEDLTGSFANEAMGRPLSGGLPAGRDGDRRRPQGRARSCSTASRRRHEARSVSSRAARSTDAGAETGRVFLGGGRHRPAPRGEEPRSGGAALEPGRGGRGRRARAEQPALRRCSGTPSSLPSSATGRGDLEHDLTRIVESARRCQRIVVNLLSFARKHPREEAAAGSERLRSQDHRPASRTTCARRRSRRCCRSPSRCPRRCSTSTRSEQVILNLVNNAEQAITATGSPAGSRFARRRPKTAVVLEVEDDGPGVPREREAPDLRPVLHHEGHRDGNGPRAVRLVRDHAGASAAASSCGPTARGRGPLRADPAARAGGARSSRSRRRCPRPRPAPGRRGACWWPRTSRSSSISSRACSRRTARR